MMMLYRAHSIAAVRKLGDEFFNQGRFSDFLVAHDQENFRKRFHLADAVTIRQEPSLSARDTERAAIALDLAMKINSFATFCALDPVAAIAWHLLGRNSERYGCHGEKHIFGHNAIGLLLRLP